MIELASDFVNFDVSLEDEKPIIKQDIKDI